MSVTGVVCDASVVLKWFHSSGEREVPAARALLAAHRLGTLRALVLDLTYYELGNVMATAKRLDGAEIADRLDDLAEICGAPVPLAPAHRRDTAELAALDGLTFYETPPTGRRPGRSPARS